MIPATATALPPSLEVEAHPAGPQRRVMVDPLGAIADSKDRLERLAVLVERHLRDPGEEGAETIQATNPEPGPLRSERWRRAAAATTVPALLAVQAWRWAAVHEAYHPSMLIPVAMGLLLCPILALNQRLARSLAISNLPSLLLLQTSLAVGLIALYQRLGPTPVFERMLLGLSLELTAMAACCAGFALLTVAMGPAPWAHRLLAAGLSIAVGAVPFIG